MTTNRLAKSETPQLKLSLQGWCDRGNEYLLSIGRHDCRWIIRDGQCRIEMIPGMAQARSDHPPSHRELAND